MTANAWIQLAFYLSVLIAVSRPLGAYIARVLSGRPTRIGRLFAPLERRLSRLAGVDPDVETGWRPYAAAMLSFNAAGLLLVYAIQRLQALLPLNPQHLGAVGPGLAFNTAV